MVQSQTEMSTTNDGATESDQLPAREEKTGRKEGNIGTSRENGLHIEVLREAQGRLMES